MSALTLELPYNYSQQELSDWLWERDLSLLKGKGNNYGHVQVGDALKNDSGIIARVVDRRRNEVNEPHIIIANKKLSKSEMHENFDTINPSKASTSGFYNGFDGGVYEDYEQSIGE